MPKGWDRESIAANSRPIRPCVRLSRAAVFFELASDDVLDARIAISFCSEHRNRKASFVKGSIERAQFKRDRDAEKRPFCTRDAVYAGRRQARAIRVSDSSGGSGDRDTGSP